MMRNNDMHIIVALSINIKHTRDYNQQQTTRFNGGLKIVKILENGHAARFKDIGTRTNNLILHKFYNNQQLIKHAAWL